MEDTLRLTVLVDNNTLTDHYFIGESGLSILIETEGHKVLFDTGYSDAFIRNAEKQGSGLLDLDYIVLSHGHLDHTWGLAHLISRLTGAAIEGVPCRMPELIAHPYCFYPRPKSPLQNIGSLIPEEQAGLHFPLRLSRTPLWLTKRLVFLGEIERRFAFEQGEPGKRQIVMPDGRIETDLLLDDSALAYQCLEGLVIITGCSHAGICNIVEQARRVCGERRVIDIIGGLHLMRPGREQLAGTRRYLEQLQLAALHACHCTDLASKIFLAGSCPLHEVGSGLRLSFEVSEHCEDEPRPG
jgi:7,8-dihydropterin-6-yl-methyl-4-(beta-D-ribofuranosyl)aminobenzene 5'-phosphate synthase